MPPANDAPIPTARLRRGVLWHLVLAGVVTGGALALLRVWFDLPALAAVASAVVFAIVAATALRGLAHHPTPDQWGDANRVTLFRGCLMVLVAAGLGIPDPSVSLQAVLGALGILALILDGVDGALARRRGLSSPYGAAFDMGLDTLLTLILALLLWRWGEVGAWALLGAGLRYLFVAAGWLWPVLRGTLPPSRRRQTVCVVVVAALAAAVTPVFGGVASLILVGGALVLLLFSFAVDTVWLIRQDRTAIR